MDPDTLMGGSRQRFPDTNYSAIQAAGSADATLRERAFETILLSYWKPAYKYVRLKWNVDNENAKDLTQGFFTLAFEKNYFAGFDAGKASFQTFIRTCLDGFVSNQRKAERSLKRGGGFAHLSLDFAEADEELVRHPVATGVSAEEFFHREWIRTLFTLALQDLRERYEASGRTIQYRLFEKYDLEPNPADGVSYASLAREFALTPVTVTNYLAAARRDFKRILLDKLRELTANEEEFRREARELLGLQLK